VSFLTLIL
jgi:choline transporter-like protein 2/4/5